MTAAATPLRSLGPRSVERPADAGCTRIRVLDDPAPGALDRSGGFAPHGVGFTVDWWIGGDDRWYLPSRETTIRQRRVGPGPVIETAMRIPSGDAIHRCYAIATPQGSATVLEITNESPVPVALALAVRPYGLDGSPPASGLRLSLDGDRILADGRLAVSLPRRPNEAQADAAADVVDRLTAGGALTGPTTAEGPGANLAVLYPLPHKTTLRFVVPGAQGAVPAHLPSLDQVAKGWATMLAPGGRFVFPDPGTADRADAARVRVLAEAVELPGRVAMLEPGAGLLLDALAASGNRHDVAASLGELATIFPIRLSTPPSAAASVVSAAARAATMLGDAASAETLLEPLMQITHLVERSGDRAAAAEALGGLALLLRLVGQPDAAVTVDAARPSGVVATSVVPADLAELTVLSEQASSTGSWGDDDVEPAARFWLGARRRLVDDGGSELLLLPEFPTAWRGGNVEVHRACTVFGPLSFAIRWHGARPALLWDLEPTDAASTVVLRCPGLDPDWRTTEPRGETLLSGAADELPPTPGEGDSFL